MKRLIAALLAGLTLFALVGCSAGSKADSAAPKDYSQILHDARTDEENEYDMIFTKGEDGKFTAIDGYSAEYEAGQLDDEVRNLMMPLLNLEDDMYTDLAASVSSMFAVYIRKLLPCFMLGSFLIATTSVSKFLAAITKLRLSKGLTIALAITLRYFPTMREEWASIRDAMALRGISASAAGLISHPIQTMEHVYVPLLVSASRISDEITQAAITRGIEHTGERSCIEEIAFSFADLLVVIAYAAVVAGMVYAGMKGVF